MEHLREKLENILHKKVTLSPIDDGAEPEGEVFVADRSRLIVHGRLTPTERELIELAVEGRFAGRKTKSDVGEEERQALLLSSWILERLEQGDTESDLPETFALWPALTGQKIPFLLYVEHPERQQEAASKELRKLLKTFFEEEIVLIPLHNQHWLVLGNMTLLPDEGEETMEESIGALASGLQEMAASEWVGECHVSATYPISPSASLLRTVSLLRETIELGRAFRVSSNTHLPWELRLETLLDSVPKRMKQRFIEGVLRRSEPSFEAEMLQTLEAFFAENCNVSDTAKRLYIHRNTLLYRLDKFKQETGMDVRDFDHAVLVRLALLLYKVTKRK